MKTKNKNLAKTPQVILQSFVGKRVRFIRSHHSDIAPGQEGVVKGVSEGGLDVETTGPYKGLAGSPSRVETWITWIEAENVELIDPISPSQPEFELLACGCKERATCTHGQALVDLAAPGTDKTVKRELDSRSELERKFDTNGGKLTEKEFHLLVVILKNERNSMLANWKASEKAYQSILKK